MSTDPRYEKVVDIFMAELSKRFVTAVDKRNFDLSELPEIVSRLTRESQTGQVLVLSSFLEKQVEALMIFQMGDVETSAKRDEVFGSNGPLSSFGSRVTLCHQLGWLSSQALESLRCFKKIRNKFAHQAYRATYADNDVAAWFAPLEQKFGAWYLNVRASSEKLDSGRELEKLSDDELKICSMAYMVGFVCLDLLLRPEAQKLGFGMQIPPPDASPLALRNVMYWMLEAVWTILYDTPADPSTD